MNTRRTVREGVFISYARSDGESAARALHARLAADAPDIPAWLDRFEIEGGVGWWRQIEQELDRAEFLLLVMTPAAMTSENTRREWRSARQRGVCVYPVMASKEQLDFTQLPGWMRKAQFYDPELEWPKLLAHLRRGCRATRVPFMAPALPPNHVARDEENEALVAWLLRPDAAAPVAITTALRGAGGFGKTTLAAAVCHDERVIEAFDDGILWVTLGQTPRLLNELVKVYAALTGERPGFVDDDDAARELAARLAEKNCLIVIDDAWQAAHARRFMLGGPGCAHLLTTRLHEVASGARTIQVDRMTGDQALRLLASRSGDAQIDPQRGQLLLKRLGYWPLAIKLAGSTLRLGIERGDSPRAALDYVERALDKHGITAFDKNDPVERSDAVADTIRASLDLLAPDERRRCTELAIFPEDQPIPLHAALRLWQCDDFDGDELARRLDGLGLVDYERSRAVLRLHDALREYMGRLLPDAPAVHGRLVDAWGDPHALPDPFAWRWVGWHLRRAGREPQLRQLLQDPRWLQAKLAATGVHALLEDFDRLDAPELATMRDALRLACPALAVDPAQFRAQLHGRMLAVAGAPGAAFAAWAATRADRPWLRLLHATLDAPGGMLRMTLSGHRKELTSLAADAQLRILLSGSADGTLAVWDWDSGRIVSRLPGRRLAVTAVAASDDGRRFLSAGADGWIERWGGEPLALVRKFSDDRRGLRAVALSADARVAVAASRESDVQVWDLATFQLQRRLVGHEESVNAVALSADGRVAASASDDGTVRLWDVANGTPLQCLRGHADAVNAVALSADASLVLSGSTDRSIRLWDAASGRCLRTLRGHDAAVMGVALSADGQRAVSGGSDDVAQVWDLSGGALVATLSGHSGAVCAAILSRDARRAATASVDRTIKLWQLDRPCDTRRTEAHVGEVVALEFSPDGRLCAWGSVDGRIKIHDVASGRVVRSIDAHAAPIRSLAFTADSACVLSAGIEDKYWLWIVETGEPAWLPVSHLTPVDYAAFGAVARYLVTTCPDRTLHLWDVPSGVKLASYGTNELFDAGPGRGSHDVAIVRLGRSGRHAVLSAMRRVRRTDVGEAVLLLLDIEALTFRFVTTGEGGIVSACDCDAAGRKLVWATLDHALAVLDLDADLGDAPVPRCIGHTEKINAVQVSADGRRAASCAADRTVTVWSLETRQALASLTMDAALRSIAWSPDDAVLAVGDVSGRVHLVKVEE
jgi:WD40 repeat protein